MKRLLWKLTKIGFVLAVLGALILGGILAVGYYKYSKTLPSTEVYENYRPSLVSRVYANDGSVIGELAKEKREYVTIDQIPPLVRNAFISAEDKRFYQHGGVDYLATLKAVYNKVIKGQRLRGASTITQQTVKNILLSSDRSYKRKIREALLARRIESDFEEKYGKKKGKDQILERYLNHIFLGQGSFGIKTAALRYFGKVSLDDLSIEEAAYLAALPKSPSALHPIRNKKKAMNRRNYVVNRLHANGFITQEEAEKAKQQDLKVDLTPYALKVADARYFVSEVLREVKKNYDQEELLKAGLTIKTTIDPALQEQAEQAFQEGLVSYDRRHGWRGAFTTLDIERPLFEQLQSFITSPKKPSGLLDSWQLAVVSNVEDSEASLLLSTGVEGRVYLRHLSWARKALKNQSLGKPVRSVKDVLKKGDVVAVEPIEGEAPLVGLRQIPEVNGALLALNPHTGSILAMVGGWDYQRSKFNRATQAKRQPGSSFKPFVYLSALDRGLEPSSVVFDAPITIRAKKGPPWKPKNFNKRFEGPLPLHEAMEKSINTVAVRLAKAVGIETVADYAKAFGVYDNLSPYYPNALGASETTLIRMLTGYAMLVNGGEKVQASLINRIQDYQGKTLLSRDQRSCASCGSQTWKGQDMPYLEENKATYIAQPETTYKLVSMLRGVVQTGTAARLGREFSQPMGGKTGTTNDSRDAWFIGFTPDLVVGTYVGFDTPKTLGKKETGGSVALPIFANFMRTYLKDKKILKFRKPESADLFLYDKKTDKYSLSSQAQGPVLDAFVPDGVDSIAPDVLYQEPDPVEVPTQQRQATEATSGTGSGLVSDELGGEIY